MEQTKKFFSDMVWSVFAVASMQGVLQIAVYPYLNRYMGAEQFGDVLYVLAIVGILAPSIGLAANNTRLIKRNEMVVGNGDSLFAMLPPFAAAAIFTGILFRQQFQLGGMILLLVTLALTMLRSYGNVEYRLALNYKGHFLYYLAISLGYLLGVVCFPLTNSWLLCFFLGELLCFILLLVKGHVYWPLTISANCRSFFYSTLPLTGSYLLNNTVLYLDRLLLQNLVDSKSVTIFYVASLLGKTAALLVGPLNGVMIGHLTKSKNQVTGKNFAKIFGAVAVVSVVLYGGILLVMPVFARLLYPEIADAVLELAWIANLSQILCFVASPLMTIMLTFCSSKWQFVIQSIYAVEFILLCLFGANAGGLWGFVWAGLASNAIRVLLVVVIGYVQIRQKSEGL